MRESLPAKEQLIQETQHSRFRFQPLKLSKKFHLHTALIIPFVLQVVGAVGLVGYLSFKSGQEAVNDLASQLRTETAMRVQDRVDRYLDIPHLIHELNVRAVEQNVLDLNNPSQLSTYFWQQSQLFSEFGTIAFANNQGDFVGANGAEDYVVFTESNPKNERSLLRYSLNDQGQLQELIGKRDNYDARTRGWYQKAVKTGQATWSEIEPSTIGQRLDIDAVYPVYNDQELLQGVLIAGFNLVLVSDFLEELQIGKTGQAFIIDRDGLIIANSTGELPFIPSPDADEDPQRLSALQSTNPVIRAATEAIINSFGGLGSLNQPQQVDFLMNGQRYFLQVLPFEDGRSLDWLIAVVIPEADFMAQIEANTRTTILLCLVALGGAIAIGILTTRLITQPILHLIQASSKLANGHLDQRVNSRYWLEIEEINTLENSFNSMVEQLQEAFENLEENVKERTAELALANNQIIALNEKLQEENLRMSAELNVARQMQQMILPKMEELNHIEGLDIAGFMQPADEVGGDYYDVLQVDGVVTLGIGDVTGHGLESGIVMVMTQTAVRILQEIRETNPVRFLTTLNRTIYQNVQRMNSDRNLSLAILNYVDGQLSISGQHEEILVVRKGGMIERIDTIDLGFPIGLDGEIADFINQVTLELEPEEGVVLYTDGIPEAENMNKVHYGIENLCQIISQNWHLSASAIQEAVITNVQEHIGKQVIYDDITLVVFKRVV